MQVGLLMFKKQIYILVLMSIFLFLVLMFITTGKILFCCCCFSVLLLGINTLSHVYFRNFLTSSFAALRGVTIPSINAASMSPIKL